MARPNESVLVTLNGYEVVKMKEKGTVLLSHRFSGNMTLRFAFLKELMAALSDERFLQNFYDSRYFFPLEALETGSARPNIKVLGVIQGVQIFKANAQGNVFITTPKGANYTLDIGMLRQLYILFTENAEFRYEVGL